MELDKETTMQNLELQIAAKRDQIQSLNAEIKFLEGKYILLKYDVTPGDEIEHEGRHGVVASEQHGNELRYYPVLKGQERTNPDLPPPCSSKLRCVYSSQQIKVIARHNKGEGK